MRPGDHAERRSGRPMDRTAVAMLADLPAPLLLERLPVPVLAVQDDGTIVLANGAFAEMLGYRREGLLLLQLHQIFRMLPPNLSVVRALRGCAGDIVELVHADQSAVRARISKSTLLRHDDPLALMTFDDLTEQLWNDPPISLLDH